MPVAKIIPARALVAVAALTLLPATAGAALRFRGPSQLFATGPSPTSVAIADLDGDGHRDLVVTNSGGYTGAGTISILRGKGDGTFGDRTDIAVGYAPQAMVVADLDHDGKPDLAVANAVGGISVLRGLGGGRFAPATEIPAGTTLHSLKATDMNGDGVLDLVTEDYVLLGNGDGSFRSPVVFGTWADSFAAVGDVDGDGHPDVVTSNYDADPDALDPASPAFMVHLGNGDGTVRALSGQGTGDACRDLALADLNGDGRLDIVVCNFGVSSRSWSGVSVFLGNGDGTFGSGRFFMTGSDPVSVAIADVNGDGKLDLATANFGGDPDFETNSVSILLGNGDGTFQRVPDLQAGDNPAYVAAGRLDGNATIDLVAVNQYSNSISVYTGNGDGTFGLPDRNPGRAPFGLAAADFDRDGRTDLAFTTFGPWPAPGGVSIMRGTGDGAFGPRVDLQVSGSPGYPGFMDAVDLNGDRVPDLVTSNQDANVMSVLLGSGDGTFRAPIEVPLVSWQGQPAAADLDRDGTMDLVLGYSANAVSVLLGNGDGSFKPAVRYATGAFPSSAAVGDLNGDGNPDVVVGLTGFALQVLLGRGDGSFAPQSQVGTGRSASRSNVALGDLDGDGRLDAVTGNLVFKGNGDGTFQQGVPYSELYAQAVAIADLDGDGRQDLVALTGDEHSGMVSIYPGHGDGTFGDRLDFGVGRYPTSLIVADFDRDGRADIAVANAVSGTISVLLNRSDAALRVQLELTPSTLSWASSGRWVSARITPPAPLTARDFDAASIRLNGTVRAEPDPNGDRGNPHELKLRFDRSAVLSTLASGTRIPVTVTGMLAGETFSGTDTIRAVGRAPIADASGQATLSVGAPLAQGSGPIRIAFTLRDASPAQLELLDIAGRRLFAQPLVGLEAGAHEWQWTGSGPLQPGIYFLRLRQGGEEVRAKAAIIR